MSLAETLLVLFKFCKNISLQVDRTGKAVRNAWEDCQSDCPRECVRWLEVMETSHQGHGSYKAGLPEYVVRTQHDGGIYSGTFLPQLGEVDIPWRGQTISKSKYQVLLITNIILENKNLQNRSVLNNP